MRPRRLPDSQNETPGGSQEVPRRSPGGPKWGPGGARSPKLKILLKFRLPKGLPARQYGTFWSPPLEKQASEGQKVSYCRAL